MKFKRIIIIESVIFFILLICQIAFGKYQSTITGSGISKIYHPVLEISKIVNSESNTVTNENNTEYKIKVANYNNEQVSDVAQSYNLQLFSDEINMANLKIQITKDDENIYLNNGTSDSFFFSAGDKQEHTFIIKISKKPQINQDIEGKVKMKIINIQNLPEQENGQ